MLLKSPNKYVKTQNELKELFDDIDIVFVKSYSILKISHKVIL